MHIGIDFDNTIIDYSSVLHKYAVNLGLIGGQTKKNKQEIRDKIRNMTNGDKLWTNLQGLVYGYHINEAKPAKGIFDFLNFCKEHSMKVSIISHKSKYPAAGPKIDMQEAARRWLWLNDFFRQYSLREKDIFFKETRKDKLEQIKIQRCTHFIDDLEDVFLDSNFPQGVTKILYSNQKKEDLPSEIITCDDWHSVRRYFLNQS